MSCDSARADRLMMDLQREGLVVASRDGAAATGVINRSR